MMIPLREDIYFHQNNSEEHQAALKLRDAVLCLRRDGAFVAVPLFRVNTGPIGPHPVGQYYGTIQKSFSLNSIMHMHQVHMKYGAHQKHFRRFTHTCVSIEAT